MRRRYAKSVSLSAPLGRSDRFDAGELDDLGPLVDVLADELAELLRRVRLGDDGAEVGEPLLDRRVVHRLVGKLVELGDDVGRRALGGADADPAGRLVALD